MKTGKPLRVAVVGAGALGVATALELARAGVKVTLIDESLSTRNASGVAAGMLGPAMESALDAVTAGRFGLLSAARDLWPAFCDGLGPTGLAECGAMLKAPSDVVERVLQSLLSQGARAQLIDTGVLFTPEDWRIEPRLALAAMLDGVQRLGGDVRRARLAELPDGTSPRLQDGETLNVDLTVLACGYGAQDLATELRWLQPIKGQILRFPDVELADGPIVRGPGGYVAPSRDGPVCGATMEPGRDDLAIDPDAVERLLAQAARLAPQLAGARATALAGVRAATADGLPLVGPSAKSNVWLAAGARRDGWLIAPQVAASMVRQIVQSAPPEPHFDPARFAA